LRTNRMKVQLVLVSLFLGLVVCQSVNPPVFVSQYLPNNYQAGQQASLVTNLDYAYNTYSGYITVNPQYNSNIFFWYIPAQNGDANAPILLWLQGGPGSASMFGLFNENGPFYVSSKNFPDLVPNNYTWTQQFSMVWMDNPVGAGWSFTESNQGYSTNEDDVADNLYSAVTQFFQLFPDLKDNDFYITGESYGGKYIPSLGYKIYNMNANPNNQYVNLVGLSIGDGLMDPLTQTQGYADLLYQLGLVDEQERTEGHVYEQTIQTLIMQLNYTSAFYVFDQYLNGDFWTYGTYYFNVTGLTSYDNFLTPTYPPNPYVEYLNLASTRNSIHTGNYPYNDYNATVEQYLIPDWMVSIRYKLTPLLDNYKVLIYNGQNDIILAGPLCENFLRTLYWSGQNEYLSAEKIIWKVESTDQQVAGYVRQVSASSLTQIQVRNAGHILPADQPRAALDMITRWITNQPFTN